MSPTRSAGRADRLGPPRAARGPSSIDVGVQEQAALRPQDRRRLRHGRGGGDHGPCAGHRRGDPPLAEKAGDRQTVVFCSTVAHARECRGGLQRGAASRPRVIHWRPRRRDAPRDPRRLCRRRNPGRRQCRGADRRLGPPAHLLRRAAAAELLQVHHDPDGRARPAHRRSGRASRRRQDRLHRAGFRDLEPDPRHAGAGRRSRRPRSDAGRSADEDLPGMRGRDPARLAPMPALRLRVPRAGRGDAAARAAFVMSEIDLLKRSSFAWEDLFGDDAALMASGFNAWGGVFFLEGRWHAVGGAKGRADPPSRGRRAHRLPRAGRRLAERPRDRRERLQVEALAEPGADREAAAIPARPRSGRITGSPATAPRR